MACLAEMRPDYLVLGPEVNFLRIFRPGEFVEFASVFRDAYALIKNISPETQVGVSIQYDVFVQEGEESQFGFVNRLPALMQAVRPVNVIWGLQHDILDYYSGEIHPLNWIGLRRLDGAPKPGWQQVLRLRAGGGR